MSERGVQLASEVGRNLLVMGKIAEQLPAKHLFRIRLTCKMWNQTFIPELKKTHTPLVLSQHSRPLPCPAQKKINQQRLKRYTESIKMHHNLPFTKYIINLYGDTREQVQNFQEFLTKFGSSITALDLDWSNRQFISVVRLRKLAFGQTPSLLESPGLAQEQGKDKLEENQDPSSARVVKNLNDKVFVNLAGNQAELVADIIEHASQLRSVMISEDLFLPVFTQISDNVGDLHKLKALHLGKSMVAELKLLVELGQRSVNALKLESFYTWVEPNSSAGGGDPIKSKAFELLYAFLLTQSPTLRQVCLEFFCLYRYQPLGRPVIPFLPQLEHVDLRLAHLKRERCGTTATYYSFISSEDY